MTNVNKTIYRHELSCGSMSDLPHNKNISCVYLDN